MSDREQYASPVNLATRIALHREFSTAAVPWHRWVRERLGDLRGLRVLDVGCGTGALWRGAESLPSLLVLTDLSPAMVRHAADVVTIAVCADMERVPFRDATFDLVVADHCLYHATSLYAALAEVRRVLRPGGRLFAATNGRDHMRELKMLAEQILGLPPLAALVTSSEFCLETSLFPLHAFFPDVDLHRYDDALRVRDPEPALAWVLSLVDEATRRAVAHRVPSLRSAIDEAIARDGAFHITKASGIFEARVPRPSEVVARDAARVLLVDPDDRVLLLEGVADSGRHFWIAPGGGLEPGEGHAVAARREIREELGIDVEPGRAIWRRTHQFRGKGHVIEQTERYFMVRVDAFDAAPERVDDYVVGHRWWTLEEIRAATDVAFAPRRLAALLGPLLDGRIPTFPIDVGP